MRLRKRRQESSDSSSSDESDDDEDYSDDNDGNNAEAGNQAESESNEEERGDDKSNEETESEEVQQVRLLGKTRRMDVDESGPLIENIAVNRIELETEEVIEQAAFPTVNPSRTEPTESLTEAQLFDAQTDVNTLKVRQVKDFLKRHGWKSVQLNKMSVPDMKAEVVKIQFDLIAKLPEEDQAGTKHNLMVMPHEYDIRARFNPTKRLQSSRHRIVHWRYEDDKGCFLVKRITGDTQVFYNTYDLTRLTEEDLRELTDLRLHNIGENSKAWEFETFF